MSYIHPLLPSQWFKEHVEEEEPKKDPQSLQLLPANGEAQQDSSSSSPTVETTDAATAAKRAANDDAPTAPVVRVFPVIGLRLVC